MLLKGPSVHFLHVGVCFTFIIRAIREMTGKVLFFRGVVINEV